MWETLKKYDDCTAAIMDNQQEIAENIKQIVFKESSKISGINDATCAKKQTGKDIRLEVLIK